MSISAELRLAWQAAPAVELGVSGFAISGLTQYDGYSPVTFLHADTLDSSRQRLGAVRGWLRAGAAEGLGGTVSASWLGTSNINRLADAEVNRTRAERRTLSGEAHPSDPGRPVQPGFFPCGTPVL